MHEVPKILVHFQLPKTYLSDPDEALIFAVDPRSGDLVLQVALTDERLASLSYARPASFPIPRDPALVLAHSILQHFAPEVARAVEHLCLVAELKVLQGGGGGEAA